MAFSGDSTYSVRHEGIFVGTQKCIIRPKLLHTFTRCLQFFPQIFQNNFFWSANWGKTGQKIEFGDRVFWRFDMLFLSMKEYLWTLKTMYSGLTFTALSRSMYRFFLRFFKIQFIWHGKAQRTRFSRNGG